MRWIIITLLLLTNNLIGQGHYIYIRDYNNTSIYNHPVQIYRRTKSTSSTVTVKVFRTHYGNGSTSQYGQFANSASDMDKMVNSAYAATTLLGTHSISATTALSWSNVNTIRNAGVNAPSNGEYFSVEVTGTFIPTQTGTYSFGINSDDGSDLFIGGTLVTSYYGGHGMSGYRYGTIYLVAGASYSFKARMQEYGGGEGLAVVWRRPSGGSYTIWTSELAGTTTWSSWSLYTTLYTNSSGYVYSNYTTTNAEYYFIIETPSSVSYSTENIIDKILYNTTNTGVDYWMWDLNNDSKITVADQYYFYARKNGRFSSFRIPNSRIFTSSQYDALLTSKSDLKSIYSGFTSIQSSTLSNGTTTYYLITPGSK